MAINFPDSPSLNEVHTVNGVDWKWDGTTWKGVGGTLPVAATATLGGIKVGTGLSIDGQGVLSADSSTISQLNTSVSVTDTGSNGTITITTEGADRWTWNDNGHLLPAVSGAAGSVAGFAIGSSAYKVREFHCSTANITPLNGITTTQLTASGDVEITGKVGIGGTASANLDLIDANNSQDLRVYSQGLSNTSKLQLRTGNSGNCIIEMGDTADADIGGIRYTNWSNENWMGFTTNASERLRITSTGALTFDATSTGHGTSGQVLTSNGDASPSWQTAGGGGTPGGSNTQLQINNNGAFGGCNIEYNPTHLDGGLEWANSSGTPGAAIRVYHSSIGGGDNSMLFYTGGGLLGTINLRIFNNSVTVYGSLTKGGGSFRIPHPLPALNATKDLAHSFIEGPQCDNIYRGKVDLVGGTATINIDTKAGMTDGTFAVLNRDVQCFTSNETGWTPVKGHVSGNTITITAQDNTCIDTISWMVIGERQDPTVKELDITDADGHLVVEPDQIPLPTI